MWCRGRDADFDELETSVREFQAIAAGRAAWRGMGEILGGFVSCLIVEMRDLFRRRQGEMAAEEAGWEGGGLSEVSGACAGVAGDAGSLDLHSTLPEASLSSSPAHPISSHPLMPHVSLAHLS